MSTSQLPPFPDEGRKPSRTRMAQSEQIRHLEGVPLFARCSRRDLRRLARHTRLDQLSDGEVLISQGSPSREAYIIVAGRAIARRNNRKVAELGPGDVVGELGLLLERDREATVIADTPLEVLALDRAALQDAVDEIPGLAWKLLETVVERLSENAKSAGHAQVVRLDVAARP